MGYNHQLTDFDLKLPAGARLATIMNTKEVIQEQLDRRWEAERQAVSSQNILVQRIQRSFRADTE